MELLLVGSAFHWMDPVLARDEFHRILKPKGLIRIFEYQFPKAPSNPELNEWIRRQFNLHWKAPGQVPRGSLAVLTQAFHGRFEPLLKQKIPMKIQLGPEDLAGLIFSQSRVLHFEGTLKGEADVAAFRESVKKHLRESMKGLPDEFDFKLSYLDFGG